MSMKRSWKEQTRGCKFHPKLTKAICDSERLGKALSWPLPHTTCSKEDAWSPRTLTSTTDRISSWMENMNWLPNNTATWQWIETPSQETCGVRRLKNFQISSYLHWLTFNSWKESSLAPPGTIRTTSWRHWNWFQCRFFSGYHQSEPPRNLMSTP